LEEFKSAQLLVHVGGHDLDSISEQHVRDIVAFLTMGRQQSTSVGIQHTCAHARAGEFTLALSSSARPSREEELRLLSTPIEKLYDSPQLTKLLWPSGRRDEQHWYGQGRRVVVFHGAKDALVLAGCYAKQGFQVLHPSYAPSLHEVACTLQASFYETVEFAHGIGAGSILALHLAAVRAVRGKPLCGVVLEAPVAKLRDVPGAGPLFGCVSTDPLSHGWKLRICNCQAIIVGGDDPVTSPTALTTFQDHPTIEESILPNGALARPIVDMLSVSNDGPSNLASNAACSVPTNGYQHRRTNDPLGEILASQRW